MHIYISKYNLNFTNLFSLVTYDLVKFLITIYQEALRL
jgi:hypothetical protein